MAGHALQRGAKAIFRHQYASNAPYRQFCQHRDISPDAVDHYRQIPAVSTEVFKHTDL